MLFVVIYCSVFFFCKQKTAYELRISDWSSDVCSSDLPASQSERGLDIAEGRTVGIASSLGGLRIVPDAEIIRCSDIHCHENCIDWHVGAVTRRRPLPSSPASGGGAFVPCGQRPEDGAPTCWLPGFGCFGFWGGAGRNGSA